MDELDLDRRAVRQTSDLLSNVNSEPTEFRRRGLSEIIIRVFASQHCRLSGAASLTVFEQTVRSACQFNKMTHCPHLAACS
jgi:hypothetical protein